MKRFIKLLVAVGLFAVLYTLLVNTDTVYESTDGHVRPTSVTIECTRSSTTGFNWIRQGVPSVHRDGYNGEYLHQYGVCRTA